MSFAARAFPPFGIEEVCDTGRCDPAAVPTVVVTRTGIREEVNYTTVRRVIELPVGRHSSPTPVSALISGAR